MTRRNLSAAARTLLALKLEDSIKARAKAHQSHGTTAPGKTLPQNSAKALPPVETREELAKLAGVSRDTVDKVRKVEKHGTPEVKQAMRNGEISMLDSFHRVGKDHPMKTACWVIVPILALHSACSSPSGGEYSRPIQQRTSSAPWHSPYQGTSYPYGTSLGQSSYQGTSYPYGTSLGQSSYQPWIDSKREAIKSPRYRTPIYSEDFTVSTTLGGNKRVSDRFGNSAIFERTLGGDLRATSNTGQTTTFSQTLGGGYKATTSDGRTYHREQNLGGGYRITGSDGSSYQRTQLLGGGYRYDRQ